MIPIDLNWDEIARAPRDSVTGFVRLIAEYRTKMGHPPTMARVTSEYYLGLATSVAAASDTVASSDEPASNHPHGYLGTLLGVALWLKDGQSEDIVFERTDAAP